MSDAVIDIQSVAKSFGSTTVLENLTLSVSQGLTFGLIYGLPMAYRSLRWLSVAEVRNELLRTHLEYGIGYLVFAGTMLALAVFVSLLAWQAAKHDWHLSSDKYAIGT